MPLSATIPGTVVKLQKALLRPYIRRKHTIADRIAKKCKLHRVTTTAISQEMKPAVSVSHSHSAPLKVEISYAAHQYDPDQAELYFKQHPIAVYNRLLELLVSVIKFLAVLASSKLSTKLKGFGNAAERPAVALQELLTNLGPSFVKLAQVLSMRPDLVGETYANALSQLQDNVAPFDNGEALAILERELDSPLDDIFSQISSGPIASASLGQVYKATLRSDGSDVAIKIQRPGVLDTIALDVYLLRKAIGLVQKAAGISRDLRALADEIGQALYGECDFTLEASNAKAFASAHGYMTFVSVPRVIIGYTTRYVLVSQWIDGEGPSSLLSRQHTDKSARKCLLSMVRMGIQCSLAQLLSTGVMHGDPHSGNLLLTADGHLCYLDFGLIVKVSDAHRQAMMGALIHMGLGEWRRLVDDLAALDLLKPETDREELAADLEHEFLLVLEENKAVAVTEGGLEGQLPLLTLATAGLSFKSLTRVLFRVAYKYKFLLPTYFPLVVRSIASLEGVALSVDPNFKIISAGMPIVLTQLLGDRREASQALLRELLLTPSGGLRTDATTEQILQVWLAAAQQTAIVSSEDLEDVNFASVLLDRRHGALRRVLLDANPAQTVRDMPQPLKEKVRAALSQSMMGDSLAPKLLFEQGGAARAQRRRLFMLFLNSVPKVLSSSPESMFKLFLFTASVTSTVMLVKTKQALLKLKAWLYNIWRTLTMRNRLPIPP